MRRGAGIDRLVRAPEQRPRLRRAHVSLEHAPARVGIRRRGRALVLADLFGLCPCRAGRAGVGPRPRGRVCGGDRRSRGGRLRMLGLRFRPRVVCCHRRAGVCLARVDRAPCRGRRGGRGHRPAPLAKAWWQRVCPPQRRCRGRRTCDAHAAPQGCPRRGAGRCRRARVRARIRRLCPGAPGVRRARHAAIRHRQRRSDPPSPAGGGARFHSRAARDAGHRGAGACLLRWPGSRPADGGTARRPRRAGGLEGSGVYCGARAVLRDFARARRCVDPWRRHRWGLDVHAAPEPAVGVADVRLGHPVVPRAPGVLR